ncbi:hypothetical protein Mpsy_1904 [Methanolobus psychrophilus R15]|nr:hypothetical protein Mpsy_1904 [Methanolobus psychrophilus R15]
MTTPQEKLRTQAFHFSESFGGKPDASSWKCIGRVWNYVCWKPLYQI